MNIKHPYGKFYTHKETGDFVYLSGDNEYTNYQVQIDEGSLTDAVAFLPATLWNKVGTDELEGHTDWDGNTILINRDIFFSTYEYHNKANKQAEKRDEQREKATPGE